MRSLRISILLMSNCLVVPGEMVQPIPASLWVEGRGERGEGGEGRGERGEGRGERGEGRGERGEGRGERGEGRGERGEGRGERGEGRGRKKRRKEGRKKEGRKKEGRKKAGGRKERESGDKVSKGGKKKLKRRGDRPGVTQTSLSAASTHQMYSQLSREERSSGFSCNKNGTRLTLTILAAEEIPALCSLRLRHNTHNLKLTVKGIFR